KGIDNGPNPSFVLIPQDSRHFDRERAISADDGRHRFVGNATIYGPTHMNPSVNNFQLGTIVRLAGPHHSTKFSALDSNGAVFCHVTPPARNGMRPRSFLHGSPHPPYATPAAVSDPRQVQLALRFSL